MESRRQGVAPLINDCDEIPTHVGPDRTHSGYTTELLNERITKCAALWRTIILSSLGKTLYPYCQYIRTLNLKQLEGMLIESEVRAGTSK